jgi:hypothetical protein
VTRRALGELRRLAFVYRRGHWLGLVVGLAGCLLIYFVNANLTRSYARPDFSNSHFTFTAGCNSSCGDARLYTYISMSRCANPVKVFMFLTPAAGPRKAWLPSRSPVAFVTNDTGARDIHLWAGSDFDRKVLNGGYLSWFLASKPSDVEQTAYYGGAGLLRRSPSGSVGRADSMQLGSATLHGITGRVPADTRYLAVAYVDDLVLKRSFGTCYLEIPMGQAMGIDTSISAKPLVSFDNFDFAVGGALTSERTSATYQLLTDSQQPSVPFGLEVDPPDSTVPIATHVGGLVSWICTPEAVDCNGGYIAVVTPTADQKLSNYTFLLGTLLGVLAGLVAAAALQFQPLPPRSPQTPA